MRTFMIAVGSAAVLMLSSTALAQRHGTADEAKAMLARVVKAVKTNQTEALDKINKGEPEFLDGDLYPFCFNIDDGKIVAIGNPDAKQLLGQDSRTFKDATGKTFGREQFAAAMRPEGQITEISYLFPRPGVDKTPVQKVSFMTRVGDLVCGVGYYE